MSNQAVATPREFLGAVEKRFGRIVIDLAANEENHVCDDWFGYRSPLGRINSLEYSWRDVSFNKGYDCDGKAIAWLNPPFAEIKDWSKKCSEEITDGMPIPIALLVPASVCTDYYIKYIAPFSYQLKLTPRPFKKEVRDCVLALYTPERYVGEEYWNWKEGT